MQLRYLGLLGLAGILSASAYWALAPTDRPQPQAEFSPAVLGTDSSELSVEGPRQRASADLEIVLYSENGDVVSMDGVTLEVMGESFPGMKIPASLDSRRVTVSREMHCSWTFMARSGAGVQRVQVPAFASIEIGFSVVGFDSIPVAASGALEVEFPHLERVSFPLVLDSDHPIVRIGWVPDGATAKVRLHGEHYRFASRQPGTLDFGEAVNAGEPASIELRFAPVVRFTAAWGDSNSPIAPAEVFLDRRSEGLGLLEVNPTESVALAYSVRVAVESQGEFLFLVAGGLPKLVPYHGPPALEYELGLLEFERPTGTVLEVHSESGEGVVGCMFFSGGHRLGARALVREGWYELAIGKDLYESLVVHAPGFESAAIQGVRVGDYRSVALRNERLLQFVLVDNNGEQVRSDTGHVVHLLHKGTFFEIPETVASGVVDQWVQPGIARDVISAFPEPDERGITVEFVNGVVSLRGIPMHNEVRYRVRSLGKRLDGEGVLDLREAELELRVEVEIPTQVREVAGRVLDPFGGGVPNATLSASPVGRPYSQGVGGSTAYDGSFTVAEVPTGALMIAVEAKGYLIHEFGPLVIDEQDPIVLQLSRGVAYHVSFSHPTANAFQIRGVALCPEGGALWSMAEAPESEAHSFGFESVAPGAYVLRAYALGQVFEKEVVVPASGGSVEWLLESEDVRVIDVVGFTTPSLTPGSRVVAEFLQDGRRVGHSQPMSVSEVLENGRYSILSPLGHWDLRLLLVPFVDGSSAVELGSAEVIVTRGDDPLVISLEN